MRILVVSDLFPPLSLGGYEVAAAEVAAALRDRGHEVQVLTTDWGGPLPDVETHVNRTLHSRQGQGPAPSAACLALWEIDDDHTVRSVLRRVSPDVVFLWNAGGLSHRVLVRLMNGPAPNLVYVFGDWPLRKFKTPHSLDPWTSRFAARQEPTLRAIARLAAALAARVAGAPTRAEPLRFDHFAFGSRFMQERFHAEGLLAGRSERVAYYGLFGAFLREAGITGVREQHSLRSILFVGRLWEAKGPGTAIEALGLLRARGENEWTLTLAGPAEHTSYATELRVRAASLDVADRVRFLGAMPREDLLGLYRSHDVTVFASMYDEPFGIVQLEAMACGSVVVGTGAGGSAEVLRDGWNGLRFRPADAAHLAERLTELRASPMLEERLRDKAKRDVLERFTGDRMVDEIEQQLVAVSAGGVL